MVSYTDSLQGFAGLVTIGLAIGLFYLRTNAGPPNWISRMVSGIIIPLYIGATVIGIDRANDDISNISFVLLLIGFSAFLVYGYLAFTVEATRSSITAVGERAENEWALFYQLLTILYLGAIVTAFGITVT